MKKNTSIILFATLFSMASAVDSDVIGGIHPNRMLREPKTCRDGKRCKTKADCKRGGCTRRKNPIVKPANLSCRNGDGCIRFCKDGSKCKVRKGK